MEIIAIAVIALAGWFGISSTEKTESDKVEQVVEVNPALTEAVSDAYVRASGYIIKDLTVPHTSPEGCFKPVLTTDLSIPSKDGIRSVTEVNTSCEG